MYKETESERERKREGAREKLVHTSIYKLKYHWAKQRGSHRRTGRIGREKERGERNESQRKKEKKKKTLTYNYNSCQLGESSVEGQYAKLVQHGQLTFRLFHFSFVSADLLLFFISDHIGFFFFLYYTVRSAYVSGYIQGDTQLHICMYIYVYIYV